MYAFYSFLKDLSLHITFSTLQIFPNLLTDHFIKVFLASEKETAAKGYNTGGIIKNLEEHHVHRDQICNP